jgi:methionyl-tRNA synthetase
LGEVEMHLGQFLIEFRLLNIDRAIKSWLAAVFAANSYVDEQAPWALRNTAPERMEQILVVLCVAIHHLALAIRPVVPAGADMILDQLGVPSDARNFPLTDAGLWHIWGASWAAALKRDGLLLPQPRPVFPRLELENEAA